jgi:glutathione peroxidase
MRIILAGVAAALFGLGLGLTFDQTRAQAADSPPAATSSQPATAPALAFTVQDIDGHDVALSQYQGKVILIVNVASKCGNTPQYAGLEAAYAKYKDRGFVILGFPANNFKSQEPGTNAQIKEFCEKTYQVDFPMFSKISVKGDDIAPLYKYLIALKTAPQPAGDITWNFEKFLIGRDGAVIARFAPKTKPEDPTVVSAIEAALGPATKQP